ncbi:MAG: right-handed parallel beta-helix repeat-containing protein [Magnetospiraceae bacterium]
MIRGKFIKVVLGLWYLVLGGVAAMPENAAAQTQCESPVLSELASGLAPGSWRQVPNTEMLPVLLEKSRALQKNGIWGGAGSVSVIEAWNGGAFDGCNWYFFGGGHKAYGGNEVYQFRTDTMTWARLTDPTPYNMDTKGVTCAPISDPEMPVPGHTYDGLVVSPKTGKLYVWGAATYCAYAGGGKREKTFSGRAQIWSFDPKTKKWIWLRRPPENHTPKADLIPETGNIAVCHLSRCSILDVASGEFSVTESVKPGGKIWGAGTLTYAPPRNLAVLLDRKRIITLAIKEGRIGGARVVKTVKTPSSLDRYGNAYDSVRDAFFLWNGGGQVLRLSPEDWALREEPEAKDGITPAGKDRGVFGRWVYLPDQDVFMGLSNVNQGFWLYKPAEAPGTKLVASPPVQVCDAAGSCEEAPDFTAGLAKASPGGTIILPPGRYRTAAEIKVPGLTLKGEIGPDGARAHFEGVAFKGKATFVTTAPGITIDGVECSGIRVGDGNGACVRIEAPDLTLRNVYFHDSQQGVLGGDGGTVTIEDSVIERNGFRGRAHGIYISKRVDTLYFRRNRVIDTVGLGHGVKSRARESVIEDNVITSIDGRDSRAIDIPNGGAAVIRGNIIAKGKNSDNRNMIGLGLEQKKGLHLPSFAIIENNTFIFTTPGVIFPKRNPISTVFEGNRIIGDAQIGTEGVEEKNNEWNIAADPQQALATALKNFSPASSEKEGQ